MTDIRVLHNKFLPTFESLGLLVELDRDVKEYFINRYSLKEVGERADSSLMFFSRSSKCSMLWASSAYIRAGLNEYYSIEDAARRDWKNSGLSGFPPRLRESVNPLIHLMYLLRHVYVHATVSKTKKITSRLLLNDPKIPIEFDMNILILDGDTLSQLTKSNEAKKYYIKTDLEKYCSWLDAQQLEFGITEVFRKGLSAYCREIIQSRM